MFEQTHLTLIVGQADDAPAESTAPPAATPENGEGQTLVDPNGDGAALDPNGDPIGTGGGSPFGGNSMFIWLIIILVVFWIFMMGGQRKEKKKRAQMLGALSKDDKIQTIGGIIGTVVEVREHEVVVKVDESSNARMRFSRGAIQQVLSTETKEKDS